VAVDPHGPAAVDPVELVVAPEAGEVVVAPEPVVEGGAL
jgi:hypothetical protein